MSTYTTTATLGLQGADGPVEVRVNRSTLDGIDVRLDLEEQTGEAERVAVYLNPSEAEEVAVALLDAADLIAPRTTEAPAAPIETSRARTHRLPHDTALRDVRTALEAAKVAEVPVARLAEELIRIARDRSLLGRVDYADARTITAIIEEHTA